MKMMNFRSYPCLIFIFYILIVKSNSQTNFLSYGTLVGDTLITPGDDEVFLIELGFDFFYFTQFYSNITLSLNGLISFGNDGLADFDKWPMGVSNSLNTIAAYDEDLYTTRCGELLTRSISDKPTLTTIGTEINSLLNPSPAFNPTNAFATTWLQVCNYDQAINGTVTFQILISTDGNRSYLIINYDLLEFPSSYGYFYQYIDLNSNLNVTSIPNPQLSNVNVNGKWLFILPDGTFFKNLYNITFILFISKKSSFSNYNNKHYNRNHFNDN